MSKLDSYAVMFTLGTEEERKDPVLLKILKERENQIYLLTDWKHFREQTDTRYIREYIDNLRYRGDNN